MALIGTLRTKMTKVVVGGVAIAMGAFIVGGDLFGNGPRSIFGGDKNSVGSINGHTVSATEFAEELKSREDSYVMNFGRQAGAREQIQLRQEAWELLILKYAITPQFEKVGQHVTEEEEEDMIWGKNVESQIKTSFRDSAGNFSRPELIRFIQTLDDPKNANNKDRWDLFRATLAPGRARVKYENLLIKTAYITEAEAERDYHAQNDVAEVKYLYVPSFAVSDSAVTVSESELQAYYKKNIDRYKTDLTRSLSFVSFPVSASKEDSISSVADFTKISEEFKTVHDDSSFVLDQKGKYEKLTSDALPKFLSDDKSKLVAGTVYGPFRDGDVYKIIKVVKIGTDTIASARASHILIKWDDETPAAKKAAKEKATKILNDIRKGASFSAMALQYGTDGTRTTGGDLGTFKSGKMVKPFEDAVFKAKKTGLLPELTETQFGYHIIDVTAVKDNAAYTVGTIDLTVEASTNTRDKIYRQAELFAADLAGVDEFKARAKKDNLAVYDANDLATSEQRINNLGEARTVINWLFRDAKKGTVSEIFDVNDTYVVAVMTGETEEGSKPLEKVKAEITPIVKQKLKNKIIIDKLAAMKGTLEEIAAAYGKDATVNSSSDLKETTSQLPGVGLDPIAVGAAFSLENGKRSKPFEGENGVLIMELRSKTIAPATGNYTMFKDQLERSNTNLISFNITEALKESSNIKDKRYKSY